MNVFCPPLRACKVFTTVCPSFRVYPAQIHIVLDVHSVPDRVLTKSNLPMVGLNLLYPIRYIKQSGSDFE